MGFWITNVLEKHHYRKHHHPFWLEEKKAPQVQAEHLFDRRMFLQVQPVQQV